LKSAEKKSQGARLGKRGGANSVDKTHRHSKKDLIVYYKAYKAPGEKEPAGTTVNREVRIFNSGRTKKRQEIRAGYYIADGNGEGGKRQGRKLSGADKTLSTKGKMWEP